MPLHLGNNEHPHVTFASPADRGLVPLLPGVVALSSPVRNPAFTRQAERDAANISPTAPSMAFPDQVDRYGRLPPFVHTFTDRCPRGPEGPKAYLDILGFVFGFSCLYVLLFLVRDH